MHSQNVVSDILIRQHIWYNVNGIHVTERGMVNRADKLGIYKEKALKILPRIALAMFLAVVLYAFIFSRNEHSMITSDAGLIEGDTVEIEGIGRVNTPYSLKARAGTKYVFKDKLPDEIPDRYGLMFYSMYSSCRVYSGDYLMGSYGTKLPLVVGRLIGNIRVLVPIDKSFAGKEITVVLIPYYSTNMDITPITYGYLDDLKLNILFDNMLRIVVVSMMFTMMLVAVCFVIYQRAHGTSHRENLIACFSQFVGAVMMWIICSSDIPQFFTNCNEGVSLISFLCLSVMGVAFVGFAKSALSVGRKVLEILYLIGWLLPIANILCFILNICDPMTLLPITHVYFVFAAVTALILAIKGAGGSTTAKLMVLSTSILLVSTAAGLTAFYVAPSKGYDAAVFGIGLTLYFFSLLGIIMHRMVRFVEEEKYINTYKEMAFKDMLTGLNNRQSFERFFDNIDEQNVEEKSITLFMFDLNYLKVVNDKYGHQAGDKLLIGLGKCLDKTFNGSGQAYRLGGDEFAAVLVGHAGEILGIVDRLKGYIDEYNRLNEHKISTAIGYATGKYKAGDVDFYIRLFREADDMMYANKIRCHNEDGEEMRDNRHLRPD